MANLLSTPIKMTGAWVLENGFSVEKGR